MHYRVGSMSGVRTIDSKTIIYATRVRNENGNAANLPACMKSPSDGDSELLSFGCRHETNRQDRRFRRPQGERQGRRESTRTQSASYLDRARHGQGRLIFSDDSFRGFRIRPDETKSLQPPERQNRQ